RTDGSSEALKEIILNRVTVELVGEDHENCFVSQRHFIAHEKNHKDQALRTGIPPALHLSGTSQEPRQWCLELREPPQKLLLVKPQPVLG
ncbi:MAG TPA: hypothetical protein VHM88_08695, partial [Candidatus Acidoferrales bacterium]|nr:hypothetical protein [Candidatus Acidoferrales bacterium]